MSKSDKKVKVDVYARSGFIIRKEGVNAFDLTGVKDPITVYSTIEEAVGEAEDGDVILTADLTPSTKFTLAVDKRAR